MILKGFESRRKAYMVSAPKADALTELQSGQLVMLDTSGKVVLCDGSTRGFLSFSDLNSERDNVTDHGGVVSFAMGSAAVTVDSASFVTGQSYAFGTRLKSSAAGLLTPFTEGTDNEKLVSAIAMGPANANGELRILQV